MKPLRIALIGKSGAGKTTIAEHLRETHDFYQASTGALCREVGALLFETPSRAILNQLADALIGVDQLVWVRAAIAGAPQGDVVLDSLRTLEEYELARREGFEIWRITAPPDVRVARLRGRGEQYALEEDDAHRFERELDEVLVDEEVINSGDLTPEELRTTIDHKLRSHGRE